MVRVLPVVLWLVAGSSSALGVCCSDCDGDGQVTIAEVVNAVNHALGTLPCDDGSEIPSTCCSDCDGDGQVTISEVVRAVNHALGTLPCVIGSQVPTSPQSPTATPLPAVTPVPAGITDWSPYFAAVWSLDEAAGTRANRRGTTCGMDCDLSEMAPVGNDTSDLREGNASLAFPIGNTAQLRCGSGCGDEPGELAPEIPTAFSWGGWIQPNEDSWHWTLFGSGNQYWTGRRLGCRAIDQAAQDRRADVSAAPLAWHHQTCVVAGTTMSVFADGAGPGDSTGLTGGMGASFGAFTLGYVGDEFSDLGHRRDELFVYQGALTAKEICRICSCQIAGELCECALEDRAVYTQTGRNVSDCNSCSLPPCDASSPGNP